MIIGYAIIVVIIFISIIIVAFGILGNEEALLDTKKINQIAMCGLIFALPGSLEQMINIFLGEEKKKFKAITKCPLCNKEIEFRIEEE